MDGTCAMRGEEEKSRKDLLDNREGKRPLGRNMNRWEDNFNMVLKGMRWTESTGSHLILQTRL